MSKGGREKGKKWRRPMKLGKAGNEAKIMEITTLQER